MDDISFTNWLENMAVKNKTGTGAPPVEPPNDYDGSDDSNWDDFEERFWQWLNSGSPCLEAMLRKTGELVTQALRLEKQGFRAHASGDGKSAIGFIDFYWKADGTAVFPVLAPELDKILLNNCDLWNALGIPQQNAWDFLHRGRNREEILNGVLHQWFGHPYIIDGSDVRGRDIGSWTVYQALEEKPELLDELRSYAEKEVPAVRGFAMQKDTTHGNFQVDPQDKSIHLSGYQSFRFLNRKDIKKVQLPSGTEATFHVQNYGELSDGEGIVYYGVNAYTDQRKKSELRIMAGPRKISWDSKEKKNTALFDSLYPPLATEEDNIELLRFASEWSCKELGLPLTSPQLDEGDRDYNGSSTHWMKVAHEKHGLGNGLQIRCLMDRGN